MTTFVLVTVQHHFGQNQNFQWEHLVYHVVEAAAYEVYRKAIALYDDISCAGNSGTQLTTGIATATGYRALCSIFAILFVQRS